MKFALSVVLAIMAIMTFGACAHAAPAAPQYDDYRTALMAFVDEHGLVDYAGLKEQRGYLDDFVIWLEQLDPKTYEAWTERDKLALWINAYNALTLRAVIDHYPIDPPMPNGNYPKNSIRQIQGVWDFNKVNVMGQSVTLGYIATKILRRDFKDARVHMALVPASVAGPVLRNEPYEGAKLDTQLDDQARKFLADPRHFRIDHSRKEVRVSEIFRWYPDDLPVQKFAAPYVNDADRTFLKDARVTYIPFDWTLNEQHL